MKITTTSVSKNQKINYWFINKMSLLEERVLQACKSVCQSNLFKDENLLIKDIIKGEFSFKEFNELYKIKGNIRSQIQQKIKSLQRQKITLQDKQTLEKITIDIFKNIEYKREGKQAFIFYEFNFRYLDFIFNKLTKGFYITSSKELKRFNSSFSPKLLRLLKSEVSLGTQNIIVKIKYSYLRKVLLGENEERDTYKNRSYFNQRVLKKAVDEINGYYKEPHSPNNRNTFISVKLTYQEKIREDDFIYHFKTSSSKNTLRLIDSTALKKATATFKALEHFESGEIIKVNHIENRQRITYEEDDFKSNSKIDEKSKDELMEDKPIF